MVRMVSWWEIYRSSNLLGLIKLIIINLIIKTKNLITFVRIFKQLFYINI